jgi:hypothetical protein
MHEDMNMFNQQATKRFSTWFPGKTAVRDRWGEPLSGVAGKREYAGANDAAARLRWSLGHG